MLRLSSNILKSSLSKRILQSQNRSLSTTIMLSHNNNYNSRTSTMKPRLITHIQSRSFAVETREFKAETRQLLDIVTNSIYTDKEVFIRELISNASDALEKLRYKQVTGEIKGVDDEPLEIRITVDKASKTVIIADNGIGMSKEDLINNLGETQFDVVYCRDMLTTVCIILILVYYRHTLFYHTHLNV